MAEEPSFCCTCTTLLSDVPRLSAASEKPLPDNRRLEDCCGRVICGECIILSRRGLCCNTLQKNPRFGGYCPFCQTAPSSSPSPSSSSAHHVSVLPFPLLSTSGASPSSSSSSPSSSSPTPSSPAAAVREDTLHFLDHEHDTVLSLSLRYGVSAAALRRANNLGSDFLLQGRRAVLIPGGGASLSPRPVEGEEEEARKAKIRRWMVATKVADYDVAVLYLEQAGYDFHDATEAYFADEAWERDHPLVNAANANGLRLPWARSRRDAARRAVNGEGPSSKRVT
ncbi:hypothetical protein B0T26DRAFT_644203 [Lasiosphaeria miniovina]|uniref:LysM domain-containing protein n=1 Tax=Lasiosphaeria miniovina TaxID=1954250 RepID=A0AA40DZI9_9PEZI|nr:uncharacterized protein B0T26DRAFT_644203 [Lasiosphaeria miniovina]KAK0722374.1 hypothetical protein B0T26DRAFT_644203 [Lasiosphaeria miniovina]